MASDRSARFHPSLSWIALGIAFLPVLAELVRHFARTPHQRTFLLAPLLFLLCATRGPVETRIPHRDGLLLLSLAVALQFVGIASGTALIGRFGLALAVVGMARWLGSPRLLVAVLAFGAVPLPDTLFAYTTPSLESLWAGAGAQFVRLLGGEVTGSGPLFHSAARRLEFLATDGGLPLLTVLMELGWYSAVRQGLSGRTLLARVALGALLTAPIQLIGATIAIFLLTFGFADVARVWLDYGLWLSVAACVVFRVERGARQSSRLRLDAGTEEI